MMQTIDFRSNENLSSSQLRTRIPRATLDTGSAAEQVRPLIHAVRDRGEAALREHAARFDGVEGHALRVPRDQMTQALDEADSGLVDALTELAQRLRVVTAAQVPPERITHISDQATVRQRWQPVERVGLYVPGGKAVYPSSVMMNVISAQVARVPSIAIASPVQREHGGVHPTILAAAAILGIDEVYAIGGASAVAAFAYGVSEIGLEPVDVITGPGNIYVAAAKREVTGVVGIDSEAGTTEILIIADDSADPRFVAADLLSQAEHDEAAASILVTTSETFARAVDVELEAMLGETEHRDRARVALTGPQSAIILVSSLTDAAHVSNVYSPEHLEIQTSSNDTVLEQITNAGAVFLGAYTPVSLGDYLAGSNHVLPTGGTARFASGLGAHTFLRPQQIVEYSREDLLAAASDVEALATAEGLPAHAEAIWTRFPERGKE